MEQELEPKSPKNALWLDQDGEDDEEELVGLLARHSSQPTKGVGTTLTSSSTAATGGEFEHDPASAPTYGRRNEEVVGDENEEEKVVKGESDGIGNSVYFGKLQGTESINGISEMQSEIPKFLILDQQVKNIEDQSIFGLSSAPVEQYEETNTSFKHLDKETKAGVNVDLIGEIDEDLMELDVERVLEKQNTHDLYCPNCNSCITRRVILRRRKPKASNKRHKAKRVKKLDPLSNFVDDDRGGDSPEIYSNASPTLAPAEQRNGTEQEQEREAFSCLSCFSLFIPIGNGCFKIFQFFRHGRQTEHARSPQEIIQRSNTQSPQEIYTSEDIQSPQEISQKENTQCPQGTNLNETAETPQKLSHNEGTQSPSKIGHNEDTQSMDEYMHIQQHISHNEDGKSPQHISGKEDISIPQKIKCNENSEIHNINQKENKQSPQKIPTAKKNWIFSVFGFHEGKATGEKAGHASSVQSAAVPILSVTIGEQVDGAAIKPKEPEISDIFSSTNSSLIDKVKSALREKPDADMLQRNTGDNEIIEDIEAGLPEPTLSPRTEVMPTSQISTQDEHRGSDAGEAYEWEILKCIVYGGLTESITSLGVVSSAAGAGADTLNVFALGIANLLGGLFVIIHNLRELKNDQPRGASTEVNIDEDRYQVQLGRRQNFVLHAIVAILSFLIFGLVPPVVYGFSFRKSDDKDLKLAAVAGASLVCIILLALGKGHVRKPHRAYFQTLSYYVVLAITASGVSYVVGELIRKLLEKLGLFESSSAVSLPFLETIPLEVGLASI